VDLLSEVIKFIVGGGAVVGVSLLVQRGLPVQAGILMTFPVITFISLIFSPKGKLVKLGQAGIVGLGFAFIFLATFLVVYQAGESRLIAIAAATVMCGGAIGLYMMLFLR